MDHTISVTLIILGNIALIFGVVLCVCRSGQDSRNGSLTPSDAVSDYAIYFHNDSSRTSAGLHEHQLSASTNGSVHRMA
jgi:hypothetical protein